MYELHIKIWQTDTDIYDYDQLIAQFLKLISGRFLLISWSVRIHQRTFVFGFNARRFSMSGGSLETSYEVETGGILIWRKCALYINRNWDYWDAKLEPTQFEQTGFPWQLLQSWARVQLGRQDLRTIGQVLVLCTILVWCGPGPPRPIFGRQGLNSGGHISGVPPPHSILQNPGKT